MVVPWPESTRNPIVRSIRSWMVLTRWRRFRPSRSSFQTISVSPSRSDFRQGFQPRTIVLLARGGGPHRAGRLHTGRK